MINFTLGYLRRFPYAFAGLKYALVHDFSFRLQALLIPILLGLVAYVAWPLREIEWFALALAYTFILITELQNSALEEALDHLHPELHMRIGRTKDMAAGSVLLAAFFTFGVILFVILT